MLLIGMLFNIFLLYFLAKKSDKGLRFLLYTLIVYWFLNFIIRPTLFLYSRDGNIDSVVYDFRLGQNSSDYSSVMLLIFLGCFVFCLPLIFNLKIKKEINEKNNYDKESREIIWIIFFGLACGVLSLLIEGTNFKNPFSKSLTSLVSVSLCIYLWKRGELKFSNTLNMIVLLVGSIGTFYYSVSQNNSKGVLLTPILVFISRLKIWDRKGYLIGKISFVTLITLVIIPVFSILQIRKLGISSASSAKANSELLPWYLSPFLEITNRFDQFARVTDAYFAEPGSLGGMTSWILYILKNLTWNPNSGRSEISFGQRWNQLVTNQSIPGSNLSNVSLSQGMIAEGYIWFGIPSLIIETFLVSIIFLWVGKSLERGAMSLVFAFGIIGSATIFEMGTVQLAGIFSGVMKIILFVWVSKRLWFSRLNYH